MWKIKDLKTVAFLLRLSICKDKSHFLKVSHYESDTNNDIDVLLVGLL